VSTVRRFRKCRCLCDASCVIVSQSHTAAFVFTGQSLCEHSATFLSPVCSTLYRASSLPSCVSNIASSGQLRYIMHWEPTDYLACCNTPYGPVSRAAAWQELSVCSRVGQPVRWKWRHTVCISSWLDGSIDVPIIDRLLCDVHTAAHQQFLMALSMCL
jgi:hypothetical protein